MKEKIVAGIGTGAKEVSIVTTGFTAPVWMQMLNSYIGFVIGIFTLIYVVWRVIDIMPKMADRYYAEKHRWKSNWKSRKAEQKLFEEWKREKEK